MQHFRNPWWPLITTTLPVAILCYVFSEAVGLVVDQLSAAQLRGWWWVALSCGSIWAMQTAYALRYQVKGRVLDRQFGLVTIAAYSLFLLLCCCGSSERIPDNVQGSVLGENRLLYLAACLSPTFTQGAMMLALCKGQKQTRAFRLARKWFFVVVPAVLAAIALSSSGHVGLYLADAGLVLTYVALHVYVVRLVIHLVMRSSWWRRVVGYGFKLAAAGAYPLSGLLVNTDIIFDILFRTYAYSGFYAITLANAIVICLPEPRQRHLRLLLSLARVVTFGFILSILALYLPVLPQSTMALASFGLGYVMLAPVLLAIVKTKMIVADISFLKLHFSRSSVLTMSLGAASVCLILGLSAFRFADAARSFAAAILHALAL